MRRYKKRAIKRKIIVGGVLVGVAAVAIGRAVRNAVENYNMFANMYDSLDDDINKGVTGGCDAGCCGDDALFGNRAAAAAHAGPDCCNHCHGSTGPILGVRVRRVTASDLPDVDPVGDLVVPDFKADDVAIEDEQPRAIPHR